MGTSGRLILLCSAVAQRYVEESCEYLILQYQYVEALSIPFCFGSSTDLSTSPSEFEADSLLLGAEQPGHLGRARIFIAGSHYRAAIIPDLGEPATRAWGSEHGGHYHD